MLTCFNWYLPIAPSSSLPLTSRGWVEGIFQPNSSWWVKKSLTQANSSQEFNPTTWIGLGWVESMGWIVFIYYYCY